MAAKAAHQPQSRRDLADLGHAVHGLPGNAGPGVLGLDTAERRKGAADLPGQRLAAAARIAKPRRALAAPHQPAIDDTVMVAGRHRFVTYRAGEGDRLRQPIAHRRGDDRGAIDRQQRVGELRREFVEMRVAGQHHLGGADPGMGGDDALSHPGRIDLQHRRILEDAGAGGLCGGGETERIVQRIDRESARIIKPVEIALRPQLLAHPVGRPRLDQRTELAGHQRRLVRLRADVVGFRHMQPAGLGECRARHAPCGVADVFGAGHRSRPQRLGAFEADPLDQRVGAERKSRQHHARVPPGRAPGNALGLQHHHRPAALGNLAGDRQPGQPRADHAEIDIELHGEPRPHRRFHRRRGIPVRSIGLGVRGQHRDVMITSLS